MCSSSRWWRNRQADSAQDAAHAPLLGVAAAGRARSERAPHIRADDFFFESSFLLSLFVRDVLIRKTGTLLRDMLADRRLLLAGSTASRHPPNRG